MATDEKLSRDGHGLPRPWPFDQPPTSGARTSRQVVHYAKPILEVYHEAGGSQGWQFHAAGELSREDVLCVSMKTIVLQDFTVTEVADLPPGWMASREAVGQPWHRSSRQS